MSTLKLLGEVEQKNSSLRIQVRNRQGEDKICARTFAIIWRNVDEEHEDEDPNL